MNKPESIPQRGQTTSRIPSADELGFDPNELRAKYNYERDRRLRADGVKVSLYRQVNSEGAWTDAAVDPDTAQQLENKILERARLLKASEIG